jgi:hypothetical protein
MIKYFSSFVKQPIGAGADKLISDMQTTIKNSLENEKITHKEYSFGKLSNSIYLLFPSPYSKYLMFGFLGNPFFCSLPMTIVGIFLFCFVALKKRVANERFFVIAVDLIGWQNALWSTENDRLKDRICWSLEKFLEKILLSYVADEIVSIADPEFLRKTYGIKKIHDIEFLEYHVNPKPHSFPEVDHLKILYAGDLGGRRGFDMELMENVLKNLNDNCELWLVTRGLDNVTLDRFKNFRNFHFLGQIPPNELDIVSKQCQFGLILYSPKYIYYNLAPPIKLSSYFANGLTVISTNLHRVKDLNVKYDFGYVFCEEDLISFLRTLSKDKIKNNSFLAEQIINATKFRDELVEMCR